MNNTTHLRETKIQPLRQNALCNSVAGEPIGQFHEIRNSHQMRYCVKGDFFGEDGGLPSQGGLWGMPNHIRSYRKKAGLTLEELAARIGMTDGNLSKLERGQIGYTQATIESVARELGCKVTDLLSEQPPLTAREETLLSIMRSLDPEDQDRFIRMAGAFSGPTPSEKQVNEEPASLNLGQRRGKQSAGRSR